MLTKEKLDNGMVRVTFRISSYVWADSITLAGEFNDRDTARHPLQQTSSDEYWHISLDLEPGRAYRFRYLVDGKDWMDDDHADRYEDNPFGSLDSVVVT
jgi:1,4-alpha-glucan branching enzyme